MKHYIVLVMELCEYDLDHLVKVEPFKEDDIVIFLHQLGKCARERERERVRVYMGVYYPYESPFNVN